MPSCLINLKDKYIYIYPEKLTHKFLDRLDDAKNKHGLLWKDDKSLRGRLQQLNSVIESLEFYGFIIQLSQGIKDYISAEFHQFSKSQELANKTIAMCEYYARKTTPAFNFRDYQKDDIRWMLSAQRGLNCLDMRLGKTLSLVAIIKQTGGIIVGPKACVSVWRKHLEWVRHDLHPVVIKKKSQFRWPRSQEVIIMHYEALPEPEDSTNARTGKITQGMNSLQKNCPSNLTVIYDECQFIKNPDAARTKRAKKLCWAVQNKNGYAWLVTGTPVPNRRKELWDFLDFLRYDSTKKLGPHLFGTKDNFLKAGPERDDEISEILSTVMVRRLRSQVFEPIEPARTMIPVELDLKTDSSLLKILDELWAKAISRGLLNDPEEILTTIQLDPEFSLYSKIRSALAKAKIPTALEIAELAEDNNDLLVVVSGHKGPVEALGSRPGWRYIHGDVTSDDRDKYIAEFQEGKLKGIALTIRTAGFAINLSKAGNLLMLDKSWTPGDNAQAEDRIVEAGSLDPLVYTDLVIDHPLEKHLYNILMNKQSEIVRIDTVANKCDNPNRTVKDIQKLHDRLKGVREDTEDEHGIGDLI